MKYLWEKLYQIVEQSGPEGISTIDLIKKMKSTKSGVYSQVNIINKKSGLKKVKNIGGTYILSDEKSGEIIPQRKSILNENVDISQVIPQKYLKLIPKLSETDRTDLLDMVKKSFFYKLTAIALLESNRITLGMNQ